MAVKGLLNKLGPGLMYAGAAIGVSHIVQSTKAGAQFGYGLLWALLVANFFKFLICQMFTDPLLIVHKVLQSLTLPVIVKS